MPTSTRRGTGRGSVEDDGCLMFEMERDGDGGGWGGAGGGGGDGSAGGAPPSRRRPA